MRVHTELGPGLLESVYEECLDLELAAAGLKFVRQQVLPIRYRGQVIQGTLRLDFVVEDSVILELKSVEKLAAIHTAQALTYLKLSGLRLCLLINFNVELLKEGIKRVALGL